MATIEELVVALTAETSSLRAEMQAGTKVVEQATDKMDKAIQAFSDNSTKNMTFFEQAAATMAGVLGSNLVTGAVNKLGEAFKFMSDQIGEGITRVAEEDKALTRLANSLALSGHYSETAQKGLQDYADELERVAGVEADVVEENLALLSSLTKLDADGLKKAQSAAVDMAAALGMDLSTATMLVAKGINGNTDAFKRYGITVKEGATKTESMANVLKALSAFQGSAAGAAQNYDGAVKKLTQSYEKLVDEYAKSIAQNPVIVAGMSTVSDILQELAGNAEDSSVALKLGVAEGFMAVIQATMVATTTVDIFIRTMTAGIQALLLPIDALVDGIDWLAAKLDGVDQKDPFKYTQSRFESLTQTIEGDTTLSKLNEQLARVYVAGEGAFGKIKSSAEAATPTLKGAAGAVAELSAAEKAHQEQIKEFSKSMSDAAMAVDANYKLQSESLTIQREMDLITETDYQNKKLELLATQQAAEAQMIQDARNQNLINEQTYQQAMLGLSQKNATDSLKAAADKKKREEDFNKERGENMKSTLSYISTLQESSSKELAAIGKAAAITTATIDGYAAVQKALASAPPPFNFALAALVGVAAAANVSKIAGVGLATGITEVPKSAAGGNNGDNFPAILKSGERVVDSQTNQDLKAFLERENAGGGGSRSVIFQLNIAPGTGITREQAEGIVSGLNDYFVSGGQKLLEQK